MNSTLLRRAFLSKAAGGIGLLALDSLLGTQASNAIAARQPGLMPSSGQAKAVICLFQHGGPSHIDLFDPKPSLGKWHGKPYPLGELEVHAKTQSGNILASPFKFKRCGAAGTELSELLPNLGKVIDDVTLIRSMKTDAVDHEAALRYIHTGRRSAGFPSWGSWTTYALGTECENLPAYVVLSDPAGFPIDGSRNWSSGWLPAAYQGTSLQIASDEANIVHLKTPASITAPARMAQLEFLKKINRRHLNQHAENNELAARIEDFELASQMQTSVPALLDLSRETRATQSLYGLDNEITREYGTRCLHARRLVEQGVRFVQIYLSGQPWDTHQNNAGDLVNLCAKTDQPCAALVHDLKQRGLLDSTIVMWGGEFGRLPVAQGTDGRDHNRHGFSLWVAGGGFKSGYVHGATDEFGYRSVGDVVTVHDLHATLLHTLGLNHTRLTYPHDGHATSLTDSEVTHAKIVHSLLENPTSKECD